MTAPSHLQRLGIPLYCHAEHHEGLLEYSRAFAALKEKGLVREYEIDVPLPLGAGLRCLPFHLRHDGGLTCGFRFESSVGSSGSIAALAYAADLGSWCPDLAGRLADVDLLALEFNHDVDLSAPADALPS